MNRFLVQWTIYAFPLDYPGHYVVRRVVIVPGHVMHAYTGCLCASLEEARACIPLGCTNLGRWPADQPQIVETWM